MSLKRKASNSASSGKKVSRPLESYDTADPSAKLSPQSSLSLAKPTQIPPNSRRTSSKELSSESHNTRTSGAMFAVAVAQGQLALVEKLRASKVDPNVRTSNDIPVLTTAVQNQQTSSIEALVSASASVNASDINGHTPLHMAVSVNDIDVVHRLLLANADVTAIDPTGRTPLAVAVMEGSQQATELLLVAKADPAQCLPSGKSLLETAITHGQVSVAKILLTSLLYQSIDAKHEWMRPRMGVFSAVPDIESLFDEILEQNNITRKDIGWCTVEELGKRKESGQSSFDYVEDSDPELFFSERRFEFLYILENLLCRLPMGVRALHTACMEHNVLAFTGCLTTPSARASVISDEKRGELVLISAVESGNLMLLRLASLLRPNVNLCDNHGKYPLLRAAKAGAVDLVRVLLDSGADVNIASKRGKNALMYAAEANHVDVAKLLLSEGVSPHALDGEGWTAVMYAARQGSVDVLDLLIAAGADVNVVRVSVVNTCKFAGGKPSNRYHGTALKLAVERGHTEVVRLLLNAGASLDSILHVLPSDGVAHAVTDTVEPPLLIAVQRGYTEVVKLLVQQPQDILDIRPYSKSLLRAAAMYNHPALIRPLVSASADVDAGYELGQSALLTAVDKGHVSVLKALIDCNADVDACGENGVTALMIACGRGDENAVRVLIGAGACVNAMDDTEGTALMAACAAGNEHISMLLLTVGADVDAVDIEGVTVIQYAHVHQNVNLLRCLFLTLCYKLAISWMEKNGVTPETTSLDELTSIFRESRQIALRRVDLTEDELSYALYDDDLDVITLCIRRWCKCILRAYEQGEDYTPLMIASAKAYPTLVNAMVCAGADTMCVNRDGERAIDIARSRCQEEVIAVLKRAEEDTLLRKKSMESQEKMLKIREEKLKQRGVDLEEEERRTRQEREREMALERARLERLREEEQKKSQQIKKRELSSARNHTGSKDVGSTRQLRLRRRSSTLNVKLEE